MIHVAIGVLINDTQQVLVAQRPEHADHGGLWEFPGGKVEVGENIFQALCRELKEEIGIDMVAASPLIKFTHDYDQYSVLLDTWLVDKFYGEPRGAEGQAVRWVNFSELQQLKMPAASSQIISMLNIG